MLKTKAINVVSSGAHKIKKTPLIVSIFEYLVIGLSGLLAGYGLSAILIPNGLLDGGFAGLAILISEILKTPFSLTLVTLSVPVLILVAFKLGISHTFRSAFGIVIFALASQYFHHAEPMTDEYLLAIVAGGVCLGLAAGLSIKYGGALDALEAIAVVVSENSRFSVDKIILWFNIALFTVATSLKGFEAGVGSVFLFYAIVSPLIAAITTAGSIYENMIVETDSPEDVAKVLEEYTASQRRVKLEEKKVFSKNSEGLYDFSGLIYEVSVKVARSEKAVLDEKVKEIDQDAVVSFTPINSVTGGEFEKKH